VADYLFMEVLLKGKAQYSWPPCSDSLFYKKENIFPFSWDSLLIDSFWTGGSDWSHRQKGWGDERGVLRSLHRTLGHPPRISRNLCCQPPLSSSAAFSCKRSVLLCSLLHNYKFKL